MRLQNEKITPTSVAKNPQLNRQLKKIGKGFFFRAELLENRKEKNYRIVQFHLFERIIAGLLRLFRKSNFLQQKVSKKGNFKLLKGKERDRALQRLLKSKGKKKEGKPVDIPPITPKPIAATVGKKINKRQEAFIKKALKLPKKFPEKDRNLEKDVTPELLEKFQKKLEGSKGSNDSTDDMKIGGNQRVIFLEEAPNLAFKVKKFGDLLTESAAKREEERSKEARKICREHNLYLLYPPVSKAFQIDKDRSDSWVIVQEKMPMEGRSRFQKGMYRFIQEQPKLKNYAKELFKQLIEFTILYQFLDVKLDNIPITFNGVVSLHDLDHEGEDGKGLYSSNLKYSAKGGVFHYLYLKKSKSLHRFARKKLKENGISKKIFEEKLKEQIAKKEKRMLKRKAYSKWMKENKVLESDQEVSLSKQVIKKKFAEKKEQELVDRFILRFNQKLKELKAGQTLDLQSSRKKNFYEEYLLNNLSLDKEQQLLPFLNKLKQVKLVQNYQIKADNKGEKLVYFYF